MDDFLTKPVDPASLAAVLDLWIGDSPDPGSSVRDVTRMPDPRPDDALAGLELFRLDELRDLDPGNTTYLDRAIGNFVTNTPTTFVTIRDAVAAGDAATVKQVVHKLAGGALNLGVTDAGRTAQQLELVVDDGNVDGAADLLPHLEEALERGRAALLAYQAAYSRP
jgi:HPt (histidine-containing phosphotransfer) domain-containing protein